MKSEIRQHGGSFRFGREHPNFPEVSGTSIPLLSTVLAGFAVTIIVQLMLRPDIAEALPLRVALALIVLLMSTLFMLSATLFAINAQANNYLPFLGLGQAARRLLDVEDVGQWIGRVERHWYVYHLATIYSFYGGLALLLTGINLLVWVYIGATVAGIFLTAIAASLAINIGVGIVTDRLDEKPSRF